MPSVFYVRRVVTVVMNFILRAWKGRVQVRPRNSVLPKIVFVFAVQRPLCGAAGTLLAVGIVVMTTLLAKPP